MNIVIVGQMEGYEKVNRVYGVTGIAPYITARDYKDPPKILIKDDEHGSSADRKYRSAQRNLG